MIIGIGARKGVTEEEVLNGIKNALFEIGKNITDIEKIASAKMKENEGGLIDAANILGIEIIFIPHKILNQMDAPSKSKAEQFGLKGVAEPAALAISKKKELIMKKKAYGRITIAIAK
ncbi:MAG: cobalamin biosynthesis protein [Methanosarcinaceae archaeon]|nr:cobalamin biosynthesis protein [Methanosarcinaceae archaeon]